MKRLSASFVLLLLVAACEAETTTPNRTSVSQPVADAGPDSAAKQDAGVADPEDGRDEDPASCYAACQNTSFTCDGNIVANLAPEQSGCSGTIGTDQKTLKLDCGAKKVCIDGACVTGTFSAFTFSYTQAGASKVVCTRD